MTTPTKVWVLQWSSKETLESEVISVHTTRRYAELAAEAIKVLRNGPLHLIIEDYPLIEEEPK